MKLIKTREENIEENYLELHYDKMDEETNAVLDRLRDTLKYIEGTYEDKHVTIALTDIFYFETVDRKTFAYTKDMSVEVKYMLDLDEITYHPTEHWKPDNKHLLHLMYFMQVDSNRVYTWTVSLRVTGGTATLARDNARACLEGQGLAAVDKWNGRLGLEDEVPFFEIPQDMPVLMGITDTLSVAVQEPVGAELIDSVGFFTIPQDMPEMMGMTDSVSFKRYVSSMTWNDVAQYTWDVLAENFVWGDD